MALLDYPPRAVSPFGIRNIPLLIDAALLVHDTIIVGSGRIGVEIEINPFALIAATSARVCSICLKSPDPRPENPTNMRRRKSDRL